LGPLKPDVTSFGLVTFPVNGILNSWQGAAAANVGDELKGVNEELIRANGKSGGPAKLALSD